MEQLEGHLVLYLSYHLTFSCLFYINSRFIILNSYWDLFIQLLAYWKYEIISFIIGWGEQEVRHNWISTIIACNPVSVIEIMLIKTRVIAKMVPLVFNMLIGSGYVGLHSGFLASLYSIIGLNYRRFFETSCHYRIKTW